MKQQIALVLTMWSFMAVPSAFAQGTDVPPALELTIAPVGGTAFTSDSSPDFGGYSYGASIAYNINRIVGIEGEFGGIAGLKQDLELATGTVHEKTPNSATYMGTVVVSVPGHRVVPYITGGIGALTLFQRAELGVTQNDTFFGGNVGGGVKWYAPNGRWGIRADYRFIAVQSKDDAPAFFGRETQYAHRVQGGLVLTLVR